MGEAHHPRAASITSAKSPSLVARHVSLVQRLAQKQQPCVQVCEDATPPLREVLRPGGAAPLLLSMARSPGGLPRVAATLLAALLACTCSPLGGTRTRGRVLVAAQDAAAVEVKKELSIHTVFSAECTPYFDWQSLALVRSHRLVVAPVRECVDKRSTDRRVSCAHPAEVPLSVLTVHASRVLCRSACLGPSPGCWRATKRR